MIESGFSIWALANPAIQALLGRSPLDLAKKIYSAFYFSFLAEQSALPAIVLDRFKSTEAADTLDARTAAATLLEGRFQFGSVAGDNVKNPGNVSGYLSTCLLSTALREQLLGLATGVAVLPDGTAIDDLWIIDEFDAHYEVGGTGYIFRRVLQVGVLFKEPDVIGAVGPPFSYPLYAGMSGGAAGGIVINAPGLGLQIATGALTTGDPHTGATFAAPAAPFQAGTFSGSWDGLMIWQQVGSSSTYVLSGSVGGIAVVMTIYKVVFAGGGFHNG